MGFISIVHDLLFPPKCVFCGRVIVSEQIMCEKCRKTLPFTQDGGRQSGDYFDCCVSPLYYKDSVRRALLRFKFRGKTMYADVFGKLLADCISGNLKDGYDIISWVPLSVTRKKSRGYDQAMLLALASALALDDVAAETLRKVTDVRAQSSIDDRAARRHNISGAYEAADPELIEGKRVLLIDDIITTGSTLSECAKVLLQAGAKNVVCAALARGE